MSKEFPLFTTYNSYISPYASGISGEELLTEFNQRAALNALGKHPVTQTARVQLNDDSWYDISLNYSQGCTGSIGEDDLRLSIRASTNGIILSQGSCLIAGYYFELINDVVIPFDELFLGDATVINPGSTSQASYYVVMLQLNLSGSSTPPASRGQRLIPILSIDDSNRSIYQCVQLVCGSKDELEAAGENCLLLGIISKNLEGEYHLWNNPLQTSIIPLDHLAGYDDLARWARLPDDAAAGAIYGIKEGDVTNTTNITDYLWLNSRSPLGDFLKHLMNNPDIAGQAGTNDQPLGTIVGSLIENNLGNLELDPHLLKLNEGDANHDPYIQYRILSGSITENRYRDMKCKLPKADPGRYNQETGTQMAAKTGMISGEDLSHLRALWEYSQSGTAPRPGREFGPFETVQAAEDFRAQHQTPGFFRENDFYWVISDSTVIEGLDKTLGTVSGTSRMSLSGSIPITADTLNIEGTLDGDQITDEKFVLTSGKITEMTCDDAAVHVDFAPGQTITLHVDSGSRTRIRLSDIEGSSTVINMSEITFDAYSDDPQHTTRWYVTDAHGPAVLSNITLSTGVDVLVGYDAIAVVSELDAASGTITLTSGDIKIKDILLEDVEYSLGTFTVNGSAVGTGHVSGDVTTNFTGKIDSISQNVSSLWVYTRIYNDPDNPTYGWVRRGVIRGFSAPATSDTLGFVKVSDGTVSGGIVLNEDDQLTLNPTDVEKLNSVGFSELSESIGSEIIITPDNAADKIKMLSGKTLKDTVKLILANSTDWNADDLPTLSRIRGDLIIDLSAVNDPAIPDEDTESNELTGSIPLLNCEDINSLTIIAGSLSDTKSTGKINIKNCTIGRSSSGENQNLGDFNNIYRWENSRFISGSPTYYPNNAWAQIDNPFGDNQSTVFVRFASFTRGEYQITGGELDIWIRREPWSSAESAPESIVLVSSTDLKFPPLLLKLDEDGNISERQELPEDLNFKISGSGGVNMTYDSVTATYVPSGNLVTTIDWESGGRLSFNARLIFQSGNQHSLKNVRFRVPVQITPKLDMLTQVTPYTNIYHT